MKLLFKKILLFLISIFTTLFILELFFQFNNTVQWLSVPLQVHRPQFLFSPPKIDNQLQKKAIEAMKLGPYSNWKYDTKTLMPYDFTKRTKKCESGESKLFKPLSSSRWTLKYSGIKKNIYDVIYSFEKFGFRSSLPNPSSTTSTTVFIGCSFTFGEGLNDDETFPSQYARLNNTTRVLNYGTPGYGPNDVLFELQSNALRATAPVSKVDTVIYTALEDHIERTTCSYRYCLQFIDYSPDRIHTPMYRIDNKNRVVQDGTFADHVPWNQIWLKHLSKSAFLNAFNLLSQPPSDKDILLTVLVLNEIKKILVGRWGVKKFVVALYPQMWSPELAHKFKIKLEEHGIIALDLSQIDAQSDLYDLYIKMDGHPSPASSYLYAWLLNESLQKMPK